MTTSADAEVLIVGAGIAGLAAARDLAAAGVRPLVVDANPAPGGVMQTAEVDGYRIEAGPNTFLARGPFSVFADRHGLWPSLAEARPESRRRALYREGKLVDLPHGPVGAVTTPLVSLGAKLRMLGEPFRRGGDPSGESVHDFIARRLGPEIATELVGAFLTGVYAGDERELGVEAVFPALVEMERNHGSLLRGALAGAFASRDASERGRSGSWGGAAGMKSVAEALAAGLPDPVRTGVRVREVARVGGSWRVGLGDESVLAKQLILATPAYATAELLASSDPACAEILAGVDYAPVVTVGFGADPAEVRGRVEGFGYIAPRSSGLRLLGCLFMSRLFEGRAPVGRELLHVLLGGVRFRECVELADDQLIESALEDLDRSLGLVAAPKTLALRRWNRAIPQPGRAHVRQMADVEQRVGSLPGLHLAGGYLAGVSVSDSLASGVRAAAGVLASTTG